MSFCINCGQELVDGAKFCANCGIAVSDNRISEQRKTIYEGELHKCPNCGELINAFVTNCPACDYEIRGKKAPSSVKEFADKLEQLEMMRETQKSKSVIGKLYGSDGKLNKTDEQKISLIRSFLIPNTKEDILEFMILAASNIDLKLYGLGDQGVITASQRAVSDAWLAKFEQAYEKATLSFSGSSDFSRVKDIYDKKIKQLKKKKREIFLLIFGILALCFVPWLLVIVLL